jgi:hypothetical protein
LPQPLVAGVHTFTTLPETGCSLKIRQENTQIKVQFRSFLRYCCKRLYVNFKKTRSF